MLIDKGAQKQQKPITIKYTTGGIYDKVSEVKENFINVEIANGVVIKIDKSAIIMDMSDAQPKR